MRLLLDTHILLWWLMDDARLTTRHRALIGDGRNEVFVSSITTAEVAIKAALGKLQLPGGFDQAVRDAGFTDLPFTSDHAGELRDLPHHHRDPFDRMLICQARVEGVPILTADAGFAPYDIDRR